MTKDETLILGEIKGQLSTIYIEHGSQLNNLSLKIDEINKNGLPLCKRNVDMIQGHDKDIKKLQRHEQRRYFSPFTLLSGGSGIAGVLGVIFFLIGKSKGWW